MKNLNLKRAMDASAYIHVLSDNVYDALFNFYIDINVDLNEINIDNDIINGLTIIDTEEFNSNYPTEDDKENISILYQDEEEIAFWN